MNNKLIIIFGVGRSGTSLLHSIISSNSKVRGLKENQVLRWILDTYSKDYFFNVKRRSKFRKHLIKETNWNRLNISENQLNKILEESKSPIIFYLNLIKYLSKDSLIICEKDPRLIDYVDTIAKNIKGVKLIHIYRNPLAVVNSRIKVEWSRSKSILLQSIIYNSQLTNLIQARTYRKKLILNLSYEEVVDKTRETCEKICSYLDILFEEEMLNPSVTSKELVTENEVWKQNTLMPITNYNSKIQNELSDESIKKIEILTPIAFKIFNYKRTYKYNIFEVLLSAILSVALLILAKLYKYLR